MGEQGEKRAYGPITVDLHKRQVALDGKEVDLTAKEFLLLRLFILNPGKTFTRDEILNKIWGDDFASEAAVVDVHISNLRKKLSGSQTFPFILTVRGIGYKSDFPGAEKITPSSVLSNLPPQLSSFVGRGMELPEVLSCIQNSRCVTLIGFGGVGKTRLALQAASQAMPRFANGVWLTRLESLSDGSLISHAVSLSLGLVREQKTADKEALLEFLSRKQLLLVLDNCEHLIESCASFVREILEHSPEVRVLATSREPLGITGEIARLVQPLRIPDAQAAISPEDLYRYDAIRLFVDRAWAANPGFKLSAKNHEVVARICRRLDGIPLAIELAAARIRAFSIEQIAAKLEDRFRLLSGGTRDSPARQQTLRGAIDWSHDLLSEDEQVLFRRIAVFAGGFSLASAEQICAGGRLKSCDVGDLISRLVDKSLLVVDEAEGGEARYRFLETVREYAEEKLSDSGESEALAEAHLNYLTVLAGEAAQHLTGPAQVEWLARLEQEHENFRKALEWSFCAPEHTRAGLELTASLRMFWRIHGHHQEGFALSLRILDQTQASEDRHLRGEVMQGASALAVQLGNLEKARSLGRSALAIFQNLGDEKWMGAALNSLGVAASMEGSYEEASSCYRESLELAERQQDQQKMAQVMNNLGVMEMRKGNLESASSFFQNALSLSRKLGNKILIASSLSNLGNLALRKGENGDALSFLQEALALSREVGLRSSEAIVLTDLGWVMLREGELDRAHDFLKESMETSLALMEKVMIAFGLEGFAALASARKNFERSARLFGAAAVLRETTRSPIPSDEREQLVPFILAAREGLGDEKFEREFSSGEELRLEDSVREAFSLKES